MARSITDTAIKIKQSNQLLTIFGVIELQQQENNYGNDYGHNDNP